MSWRYGDWSVRHALPIGASTRPADGDAVTAGDIIATGTTFGPPVRVSGAKHIGVAPADLPRVMRVPPGAEVERRAVLARTGRRFARAVTAPIAGRLAHVRGDGDFELAPVIGHWVVRSTMTGVVTRSTEAEIVVEGAAWCLQGLAAYGPDAIGDLALIADRPSDEVAPSRIDVGQRGRILVGGGRSGAESIARAHACGVEAIVAGAVPASGLRAVFGDDVGAHGQTTRADAPTVLCLEGFGSSMVPTSLYSPFRVFAGERAAIHTASARLFVFAGPSADAASATAPSVALALDWGSVHAVEGPVAIREDARFASEIIAPAVVIDGSAMPAANVLGFDAAR